MTELLHNIHVHQLEAGSDAQILAGARLSHAFRSGAPTVFGLLQSSDTLETARERLFSYLNGLERALLNGATEVHPLEYATARQCLQVLKNVISRRNEGLAGFSTLHALWGLAQHEQGDEPAVEEGFLEEFLHLIRGAAGKSGMSEGWLGSRLSQQGVEPVDFDRVHGRMAGVERSDYLDAVSAETNDLIARFPSGLDAGQIAMREGNVRRILDFFDAGPDDWSDYRWHLRHIITGRDALEQLQRLITLSPEEEESIRLCVEHHIPFGITPYYLSLFDFESHDKGEDCVVRSQVLPPLHYVQRMIDHREDREFYFDFMGEHDTSPIDLVTRRYPGIAILKGYGTCPQICVYCQRNWEISEPMQDGATPARDRLDEAIDWFQAHPELRSVLITGGDPFFVRDERIQYIMDRFAQIEHIINIRWGTRSVVTVPMRVTEELATLLGSYVEPGRRNVAVVTHVESPAEVTPAVAEAAYRLRRQGIYVYNQQVFTLHTSLRFHTVANRIALKQVGIDPYYTFFPKGKEETRDYTVPLARLLQERKEEARLLPGAFRTDEPVFNVPRMGKTHVRAAQDRELIAIRPDGRRVYLWHPWEKGITPTEPALYLDNSIHKYLEDVARLGEDPADYSSIWYYF
jgi:lysine 2,3-aminomutase